MRILHLQCAFLKLDSYESDDFDASGVSDDMGESVFFFMKLTILVILVSGESIESGESSKSGDSVDSGE